MNYFSPFGKKSLEKETSCEGQLHFLPISSKQTELTEFKKLAKDCENLAAKQNLIRELALLPGNVLDCKSYRARIKKRFNPLEGEGKILFSQGSARDEGRRFFSCGARIPA